MISDQKYEADLLKIRDSMEAYIDRKLEAVGVTVPLTVVDESIKDICADLCAGDFERRKSPPGEDPALWVVGNAKLDEYIKAKYKSGGLYRG